MVSGNILTGKSHWLFHSRIYGFGFRFSLKTNPSKRTSTKKTINITEKSYTYLKIMWKRCTSDAAQRGTSWPKVAPMWWPSWWAASSPRRSSTGQDGDLFLDFSRVFRCFFQVWHDSAEIFHIFVYLAEIFQVLGFVFDFSRCFFGFLGLCLPMFSTIVPNFLDDSYWSSWFFQFRASVSCLKIGKLLKLCSNLKGIVHPTK